MVILPPNQPAGEESAPPSICPVCQQYATGHRLESIPVDVPRAQYLCGDGHLWITSWFAPEDGAA